MRRRSQNVCVTAGLALLGAILGDGREARADLTSEAGAATTSQGINISGTYTPEKGDPPYLYSFTVDLNAGNTLVGGDSFTIDDLPGITRRSQYLSTTSSPADWSITSISYEGQDPSDSHLVLSDVTWTYTGPTVGPVTGTQSFTPFDIETTQSLPNPPANPINYAYTVDGVPGTGALTLTATPEPSSATIVLLIGGLAAGSGMVARARRRRSAGTDR